MEEAKTSAASETEETDKTETTPGELSEPASRDMAKDPANQQMEEEPGTVETAGATNASDMDAPLSVEEANDKVAQMLKKAAKTKKTQHSKQPRKFKRVHEENHTQEHQQPIQINASMIYPL